MYFRKKLAAAGRAENAAQLFGQQVTYLFLIDFVIAPRTDDFLFNQIGIQQDFQVIREFGLCHFDNLAQIADARFSLLGEDMQDVEPLFVCQRFELDFVGVKKRVVDGLADLGQLSHGGHLLRSFIKFS
jgi:hypothetical protein